MVKPIPDGYPRFTPYLIVDGASAAIDFYTSVLGATERMRMPAPEDKVGHAELDPPRGARLDFTDPFPSRCTCTSRMSTPSLTEP